LPSSNPITEVGERFVRREGKKGQGGDVIGNSGKTSGSRSNYWAAFQILHVVKSLN
jgi:hypothetical protein